VNYSITVLVFDYVCRFKDVFEFMLKARLLNLLIFDKKFRFLLNNTTDMNDKKNG
jgi:hypothetical protein